MSRGDVHACVCANMNTPQFIHWVLLCLVTNTATCRYTHMLTPALYMLSRYYTGGSIPCCVFSSGCSRTLKLTGGEYPPAVQHCMSATLTTLSD